MDFAMDCFSNSPLSLSILHVLILLVCFFLLRIAAPSPRSDSVGHGVSIRARGSPGGERARAERAGREVNV
eukprot:8409120-Pyramimonas_sp.AAC.1